MASPYSDEQATRWLSWLARGMREHGQTVFHIEQLQPSWLMWGQEVWIYLFATRLTDSLLATMAIAIVDLLFDLGGHSLKGSLVLGSYMGLSFGLISGWRFFVWRQDQQPSCSGRTGMFRRVRPLLDALFIGLGMILMAGTAFRWLPPGDATCLGSLSLVILGPYLLGRFLRKPIDDIGLVQSLGWSWLGATRGGGVWLLVVLILAIPVYYVNEGLLWALFLLTVLFVAVPTIVFGAMLGGLKRKAREMPARPLEGIRQSLRSAAFAAASAGMVTSFAVLAAMEWQGFLDDTSLLLATLIGLTIALLVALWFGVLDVINHYILRAILVRKNYLPLNLVDFLDHAADELRFLQKVGGGYMFIHRSLLEYFAELGEEKEDMDVEADHAAGGLATNRSRS